MKKTFKNFIEIYKVFGRLSNRRLRFVPIENYSGLSYFSFVYLLLTLHNNASEFCLKYLQFLQKNELSKLYHVRHKETSMFYTMEVSPRDSSSKAPISPYVQQPTTRFSPFLVNLQFTFQTRSKFYYILDFPGKETLSQRAKSFGGTFPEPQARFYAAEILIALEELHNFSLAYSELSLDTVYVEPSGHVMLWRNFCGKFYWSKRECVCSLHGFSHGDPCNNNHEPKSDFDFQEDWRTFGSVLYTMLTGKNSPSSVTNDRYVQHLEV